MNILLKIRDLLFKRHFNNLDKILSIEPDLEQEYTFIANLKGQNIPVRYSKYQATTVPKKGAIIFLCGDQESLVREPDHEESP